jgi:hypothetical protein
MYGGSYKSKNSGDLNFANCFLVHYRGRYILCPLRVGLPGFRRVSIEAPARRRAIEPNKRVDIIL